MSYNTEKIVIIGLGETGFSCVEYFAKLKASQPNILIMVADSRKNPRKLQELQTKYPEVKIHTGGFPEEVLREATQIIISPGIAKDHPDLKFKIKKGVPIIGDIELFAREIKAPVIAITGSNGKSTVTTLVGEMAKQAGIKVSVGGNIGVPALDLLDSRPDLYVLELSSFQLETTYSLKPLVSTILNICPDHMDRYVSVEDYTAAKARIFRHSQSVVVNRDDEWVLKQIPNDIPRLSFGLNPPIGDNFGLVEDQLVKGKERLLSIADLKLFGRHNVANALAALALGDSAKFPMAAMLTALRAFKGLEHRCEWVRTFNGIPWINDSKGTNVGASMAAIGGLANDIPGKWVLIAGGQGKNADFTPLKPLIKAHCRAVVLIGETAIELRDLLSDSLPCWVVSNLKEAVQRAVELAIPGDGVLLSPACASYDMFWNFEERGQIFKKLVHEL